MTAIDERASFEPSRPPAGKSKPKTSAPAPAQSAGAAFVAFTVDTGTGRVVNVEGVDAAGARHELSEAERTSLSGAAAGTTLEGLVEQAFEAGVNWVLGEDGAEQSASVSEEDTDLRRELLRSLIGHSAARRLIQREVLDRVIVGTLIQQAAAAAAGGPTSTANTAAH